MQLLGTNFRNLWTQNPYLICIIISLQGESFEFVSPVIFRVANCVAVFLVTALAIPQEQREPVKFCMSGEWGPKKSRNAVPHDIGDPGNIC